MLHLSRQATLIDTLKLPGPQAAKCSLHFSQLEPLLTFGTAEDGTTFVWNTAKQQLQDHYPRIHKVELESDSKLCVQHSSV